jgi:hypothetical protein
VAQILNRELEAFGPAQLDQLHKIGVTFQHGNAIVEVPAAPTHESLCGPDAHDEPRA